MKGKCNMKNFIRNYLIKYIFIFFFFMLFGKIFKSINMDINKAFAFTCGTILYDGLLYIYRKFQRNKVSN